ncbi:high mobility group box domain-containing protein, partial [Jimgerdemannia flammicorona]
MTTSPARGMLATTGKLGGRGSKKDLRKTPRPQNAFMIYRREKHPFVVAENKGLHNKEVSRIVGRLWRCESEEVRRAYERKADFAKLEHQVKYPGYKYEPRKPIKKKSWAKQPRPAASGERFNVQQPASFNTGPVLPPGWDFQTLENVQQVIPLQEDLEGGGREG